MSANRIGGCQHPRAGFGQPKVLFKIWQEWSESPKEKRLQEADRAGEDEDPPRAA